MSVQAYIEIFVFIKLSLACLPEVNVELK